MSYEEDTSLFNEDTSEEEKDSWDLSFEYDSNYEEESDSEEEIEIQGGIISHKKLKKKVFTKCEK